jgi:hypothetical protein
MTLLVGLSDPPKSNTIGQTNLFTLALVAIIYCLSLFIGICLFQFVVLAYLLHPLHILDFNSFY